MITIHPSGSRGRAELEWLSARHTFSFGYYHNPDHMAFRSLRVLNEDVIQPASGFDTHGHREMEIVTYLLEGELAHRDSLGREAVIRPGLVQRMSAGTGIRHSEHNPSRNQTTRLFQIWIEPDREGHAPRYEERHFLRDEAQGRLRPIVTPSGEGGTLSIHQDAQIYDGLLRAGTTLRHPIRPGRHVWLQVAQGSLVVNGHPIEAGDGLAASGEEALEIHAERESLILLFDLA